MVKPKDHRYDADEELARKLQAEMDEEPYDPRFVKGGASKHVGPAPKTHEKGKGKATSTAVAPTEQVDKDLEKVRAFYAKITSVRCRKCQSRLIQDFDPKSHLGEWSSSAGEGKDTSICAVTCSKSGCGTSTCIGCGEKPTVGTNTSRTDAGKLDWCCDRGRMFAIWVLLARYDQVELQMQEREARKAAEQAQKAQYMSQVYPGHHHLHGKKPNKGTGYVANSGFDNPLMFVDEANMYGARAVRAINFQSADRQTDDVLGQLLALISTLLPSRRRKTRTSFDESPSSSLHASLRLGLLIDKVAQLLRNDSIADISKRHKVYFAALEFVNVLGRNPATAELVTQERYYKRGTSGLQALASSSTNGEDNDPKGKDKGKAVALKTSPQMVELGDIQDGNAPPLIARLENLVKQSEIMLGLGSKEEVRRSMQQSEGEKTSMALCQTIVDVYKKVVGESNDTNLGDHAIANLEIDLKQLDLRSDEDVRKAWEAYHREHCFELTEEVMSTHHYAFRFPLHTSPKGRIPYLMKEMASMATSLPVGIFVKASADNPGVFKALIVGPDDTPYEGGLFEFDIACPLSYPVDPPSVFFRGTHSGRADMNPNLHRDGKVCLSLLGTFDGPPESKWQSGRSTLLSVLVSIQGMILVPEPWRNEPGNGNAYDPEAKRLCHHYTLQRQALTTRYAILPWLRDRRLKDGVWKKEVGTYYGLHKRRVWMRVKEWSVSSWGIRSFREPMSMLEAVRTFEEGGRGTDLLKVLSEVLGSL